MRVFVAIAIALALPGCGARTGLGPITQSDDAGTHADAHADADADASTPTCFASGPIAVAQTGGRADAIALDGAFVYWHDENGVSRAPKTGGVGQLLATTSSLSWPELSSFAVGGGNVFFADGTNLSRVPVGGGASQPIAFALVVSVATSATHLYAWVPSANGFRVEQLDFMGSGLTVVAELPLSPNAMFFTSTNGYAAADPGVYVLDLNGGATLLSGLTASDVVADDAHVFFTSNDPTNGARVIAVDPSTLATTTIADTFGALTLAIDAHDLYFVDSNAGRIRKIAGKMGSVSDVAITAQESLPVDIAVDDGCVYWSAASRTSAGDPGAIFAAPKP